MSQSCHFPGFSSNLQFFTFPAPISQSVPTFTSGVRLQAPLSLLPFSHGFPFHVTWLQERAGEGTEKANSLSSRAHTSLPTPLPTLTKSSRYKGCPGSFLHPSSFLSHHTKFNSRTTVQIWPFSKILPMFKHVNMICLKVLDMYWHVILGKRHDKP